MWWDEVKAKATSLVDPTKLATYEEIVNKEKNSEKATHSLYTSLRERGVRGVDLKDSLKNERALWQKWGSHTFSPFDENASYHSLLDYRGVVIHIPAGFKGEDTIPLTPELGSPPPFSQVIVLVGQGSEVCLMEACQGARFPKDGVRAPKITIIGETGAKIRLLGYQDSVHAQKNLGLRQIILEEGAKASIIDVLVGSIPQPTCWRYNATGAAQLTSQIVSIPQKNKAQAIKLIHEGPLKVRTEVVEFSSSQSLLSWQGTPPTNRRTVNLNETNRDSAAFIRRHGVNNEVYRDLMYQDLLEPFLQDFPIEYKVEILSQLPS